MDSTSSDKCIISAIKDSIKNPFKGRKYNNDNLTPGQRIALEQIKERDDIAIQKADEGGEIVIMDKGDYVNACEELLNDNEYYQREEVDQNKAFAFEIKETVENMNET